MRGSAQAAARTSTELKRPVAIELALQGGGAHGAFTWGVLDRLLEEDALEIAAISGTSAGAMNAVVLAGGLQEGGREGARAALRRFWMRVADAAPANPFALNPFTALFGEMMTRVASPYQLNPLNLNPLREILAATVDFERLRRGGVPALFVAATAVSTGRLRVFGRGELAAEHVLASACLPMLFQAVDIDGEAYWDGGYVANPPLLPLVRESPAHDLVIVQINPVRRAGLPRRAQDILDRVNEVSFNSSLVHDMQTLALLKRLIDDEGIPGHRYREPRVARVDARDGAERRRRLAVLAPPRPRPALEHAPVGVPPVTPLAGVLIIPASIALGAFTSTMGWTMAPAPRCFGSFQGKR